MAHPVISHFVLLLGLVLFHVPGMAQSTDNQAVILQYHHVSTTTPPSTSLSREAFIQHMNYLEDNNFSLLPLEDIVSKLKSGQTLPDKTAAITFDDGYTSVYDTAFPLLKEHGWPFTVFVNPGLVGSNDRLYATWEQLGEMASAGATIANHTMNHPYLLGRQAGESENQWLARVRQEITQAEQVIAEQTGQNHKLLAYPYGEYNPVIQKLVSDLGYTGIGQHSGAINSHSDFTALPRFPFSGIYASMNTFPTKVMSLAFTLDSIFPESPVTSDTMPEAVLDFAAGQAGLSQLACFNNNEMISVTAEDAVAGRYRIRTHVDNRTRRFRYNCTAPGPGGRYYWYSIPWTNPAVRE